MDGNNINVTLKENTAAADSSTEQAATTEPKTSNAEKKIEEQNSQSRWKSWTMWLSVLGALWIIASAFGLPPKIGLTNDTFNVIVNAAGTILIALGIVNNPTNPTSL